MSSYVNKHVFYDGAMVLYQRDLSIAVPDAKRHRPATWYMRLKIAGHKGYYTASTKLTTYEDAYEYAKSELLRLQQAAKLGHTLDEYTFDQHWDDWYQRNVDSNAWKPDRQRWHKMYANRYFKPYFRNSDGTSKLLNEITPQMAVGYWDWRRTYWSREQGQRLIAYNPKRRGAKTTTTNNAKKTPSAKTLQMEQSALNQIFHDAAERGRLQQVIRLRSPAKVGKDDRRPTIEAGDEYDKMVRYLRSYRDCVGVFKGARINAWHRKQREQLYYFVLIMANSGLRPGEARELTWGDVTFDVAMSGSDLLIAELRVPDDTKRGYRYVQTQPNCNEYLKAWHEATPYKDETHPVFFGQKQGDDKPQKFKDLNRNFQEFLRKVPVKGREDGMLCDRDGNKRSLYSLRHAYATMRIELGNVKYEDLAINMGCTVVQIAKHYSHATPKTRRRQITQMAPKPEKQRKIAEQNAANASSDSFAAEAVRRFQSGELSETALLEILRSKKS